jgi:hypothetical protein
MQLEDRMMMKDQIDLCVLLGLFGVEFYVKHVFKVLGI